MSQFEQRICFLERKFKEAYGRKLDLRDIEPGNDFLFSIITSVLQKYEARLNLKCRKLERLTRKCARCGRRLDE